MAKKITEDIGRVSPYQIEVFQDGEVVGVLHFESALIAVEAWDKFTDYGDAHRVRHLTFTGANGETAHKTFYAPNPR